MVIKMLPEGLLWFNHCLQCQHAMSVSSTLRFLSSSRLMHLRKQQKTTQVLGLLPPMWENRRGPCSWLQPGLVLASAALCASLCSLNDLLCNYAFQIMKINLIKFLKCHFEYSHPILECLCSSPSQAYSSFLLIRALPSTQKTQMEVWLWHGPAMAIKVI